MIRNLLRIFVSLIVFSFAYLSAAANDWTRADSAYKAEDYKTAVELYNRILNTQGASSDLYYNLGNAYYRSGNVAQAILSYERSLRLDPTNSDAKDNLKFVNERIVDEKGQTGSFLSTAFNDITALMTSNGWAITALVLFILTALAIAGYYFVGSVAVKKLGFFGGIVTLLLTIVCLIFAFHGRTMQSRTDYAIITAPTTVLSTVPRQPANRNEEAMLLHEGTKVKILNTVTFKADTANQTWHDVEIDNNHRAWINDSDIEKIF